MTALTLWRGSERLGELHPHESRPGQLTAVLVPAGGVGELASVMQTRLDIVPGQPVFEHLLEPLVAADRRSPDAGRRSQAVPSRRLSDAERHGIPAERQLMVRDGAGRALGAGLVTLQEFRPVPRSEARVLAGFPAGALHRGAIWLVSVGLDSADPVA